MINIRIVYSCEESASHNTALILQNYAPSDCSVFIDGIDKNSDTNSIIGEIEVDLLFLLTHFTSYRIRDEVEARDWKTKIVRSSHYRWPHDVSSFFDAYCDSDALFLNKRNLWLNTGQLNGTIPPSMGVDLEFYITKYLLKHRTPRILRMLLHKMQNRIQDWHWAQRHLTIFDILRDVISDNQLKKQGESWHSLPKPNLGSVQNAPNAKYNDTLPLDFVSNKKTDDDYLDISDTLTVFVITVGAPSFKACLKCLSQQNCHFSVKVIDHVAPMSRAFQKMLDDCETTYFVQVDEDMLLFPNAIRTLHEMILSSAACLYVANLYDVHLENCIHGIKIYRHEVVRNYPYEDVESCEKSQLRQLLADGHTFQSEPIIEAKCGPADSLGLHGAYWTSNSIFERYMTLSSKLKKNPNEMEWVRDCQDLFLKRFLDLPSEQNFFALMALVCGAFDQHEQSLGEKDFRHYQKLPGFKLLEELWSVLSHASNEIDKSSPSNRYKEMEWVRDCQDLLLKRFLDLPSEQNFFPLMALVCGAFNQHDQFRGEKAFQQYQKLPSYKLLEELWSELSQEPNEIDESSPLN